MGSILIKLQDLPYLLVAFTVGPNKGKNENHAETAGRCS